MAYKSVLRESCLRQGAAPGPSATSRTRELTTRRWDSPTATQCGLAVPSVLSCSKSIVRTLGGDRSTCPDGFYNVCVNANGSKQFGIVLPTPPGKEPLILFFLGLPMGWVSSPPTFCALAKSAADVANERIDANWSPRGHRCDSAADTPTESTRPASKPGPPPRIRHRVKGPVGRTDVYVDDFILLAQGGKRRRKRLRRILFHCIDMIFCPPDDDDDQWKKDPISLKKLLKGDGALETVKVILGWLVDTVAGTIELPPNQVERLQEILAAFPRSRRTVLRKTCTSWSESCAVCSSLCPAVLAACLGCRRLSRRLTTECT